MVLADLGGAITGALHKMGASTVIDKKVLDELLNDISKALMYADVNFSLIKELNTNIRKNVKLDQLGAGTNKRKAIEQTVIGEICNMLDPGVTPYAPKKGKPNVIMFVGLQGSGKTTTCTKYAWYWKQKGWRTCLVCADTFRAGAFDQLRQNAAGARIPFYGSYTETDPVKLAQDGVDKFRKEQFEIIIVDTSGRHKQEAELFEEMEQVAAVVQPDDVVFVMDSSIGQAAQDQAAAFKDSIDVGSVIITKLDGHAKGGGALSAVAATKSPIIFYGTGEHKEDFEPFKVNSFVGRLLGRGDLESLMTKMTDAFTPDKQQKLMDNLVKGVFTMRDMYDQLETIMKMGPLGKTLADLPMGEQLLQGNDPEMATVRFKRMLYIMDSMTDDELDCVVKIAGNDSRIRRVAIGSGSSLRDVHEFLEQYKMMSGMMSKMGKMAGGDPSKLMGMGRGGGGMPDLSQLQNILPPGMLNQMGGMGGLKGMMDQLKGMDLGAMMGQMGMGGLPGMGGGAPAAGRGGRRR